MSSATLRASQIAHAPSHHTGWHTEAVVKWMVYSKQNYQSKKGGKEGDERKEKEKQKGRKQVYTLKRIEKRTLIIKKCFYMAQWLLKRSLAHTKKPII